MASPTDPVNINGKWWHYDERTQTHRPVDDHAAREVADLELPASRESVAAGKGPAFDSRVDITIVSYRSRLADPDGVSAKAAIDGLVMCGILKDDSAKEVREVRYRQIKVKGAWEEKTEIIIEVAK